MSSTIRFVSLHEERLQFTEPVQYILAILLHMKIDQ